MSTLDHDIVIVGAGLIGSLCAVLLAQSGYEVSLVEKEPVATAKNGERDGRSLVLSLSSIHILHELGLWDSIKSKAWPIKRIRVTDQGSFGKLELDATDIQKTELGFACSSTTLLSVFRAAARSSSKITLLDKVQFVDCNDVGEHIGVILRSSDVSRDDRHLTARLLIGADGEKSKVRSCAGIPTLCTDYHQSAIVCSLSAHENLPHVAFEHFTRDGPLAIIPTGDKRYVSVQCLKSGSEQNVLAMSAQEYAETLSYRLGHRLGRVFDLGRRFSYPLSAIHAERLFCGRVVLVGDAANRVHPNGAQGLNLGIRDAWFLRRTLTSPVNDPGTTAALLKYNEFRKGDHAKTRCLSKGLAIIFRSNNMFFSGARRLALGAMGLSEQLRARFLLGATGLSELGQQHD